MSCEPIPAQPGARRGRKRKLGPLAQRDARQSATPHGYWGRGGLVYEGGYWGRGRLVCEGKGG